MQLSLHAGDFETLQQAVDTALSQQRPLRLEAQPYGVDAPLIVAGQVELVGSCGLLDATSIYPTRPMESVVKFNSVPQAWQLTIDGRWLATSAAVFANGSYGNVDNCKFLRGRRDGALVAVTSGGVGFQNFRNVDFAQNGTTCVTDGYPFQATNSNVLRVAGTISTVAGVPVLIGTGTSFTTDLAGLRHGDMISVGVGPTEWLQLCDVLDDTHVTLLPNRRLPGLTRDGQGFCVGIGDGYHESCSTNIGPNNVINCRGFHNAGSGAVLQGFWGAMLGGKFHGLNNNFFPIVLGGEGAIANAEIGGLYFEGNGAPAGVFASYANGFKVKNVNGDKFPPSPIDGRPTSTMTSNDAIVVGKESNIQGDDGFSERAIGSQFYSTVPVTVVKENAYLRGRMFGDATPSGRPGRGFLDIKDSDGTATRPPGAILAGAAGNDPNAVAVQLGPVDQYVSDGARVTVFRNGVSGPVVGYLDHRGNLYLAGQVFPGSI